MARFAKTWQPRFIISSAPGASFTISRMETNSGLGIRTNTSPSRIRTSAAPRFQRPATAAPSLEHEVNVSYRHLFSPKWVNQLRFLVGYNDQRTTQRESATRRLSCRVLLPEAERKPTSTAPNIISMGPNITTYASGRHTVNFSVESPDISRRGFDDFTNSGGTYTFASLADFQLGLPSAFVLQSGQPHVAFLEKVFGGVRSGRFSMEAEFLVVGGAPLLLAELLSRRLEQLRAALRFCLRAYEERQDRHSRRSGSVLRPHWSAPDLRPAPLQRSDFAALHSR